MLKEGDFIIYRGENLLILNDMHKEFSFYTVLYKASFYRGDVYYVKGMPLNSHDVIINNDDPLKIDFMEAILKGNVIYKASMRHIFGKK